MMKALAIILAAFILLFGCVADGQQQEARLSQSQALGIAKNSACAEAGTVLAEAFYNNNTRTWWFGFEPGEPKSGCNPACVVSEETLGAEINWRCTGLNVPGGGQGELPPNQTNETEEGFVLCPKGERPEFCTMEYNPVCGKVHDYYRDFGNPCMGCAFGGDVIGYYMGTCSENGIATQAG